MAAVIKLNEKFLLYAIDVESATNRAPEVRQQLLATLKPAVAVLTLATNELVQAIPVARDRVLPPPK